MKFPEFCEKIQMILEAELPSSEMVAREGRTMANDIRVGRTAFMDKMGVDSELGYKRQCIREKRIMFHAHIGMNSWPATAEALVFLNNTAESEEFVIDRAGICLDRRMALPTAFRKNIPAETGPMLDTPQQWQELGHLVPIQPHMGDFMIGFPNSLENTIEALKAGCTTIGNLSQFFSHEAPLWRDAVTTTRETVKSIALMGSLIDKGTLVHSYLEDGFGALFHDCATVAGWAYLERYIVENLLGAKLAHCIGGLTTDPIKRAGWVFALDEIHEHNCVGSMFYGNTLSFSADFTKNRAFIGEYLIWDILAQLECPTGHAVLPLPLTEGLRVPSMQEIAEAQRFGNHMEETARRLWPHFDFSAALDFSQFIVSAGESVFQNALSGLKEAGVDIMDPIELLYVLKKIGPAVFEELFGPGEPHEEFSRGHALIVPTDTYDMSTKYIQEYRSIFDNTKGNGMFRGRRILVASADVHEYAIDILQQLLSEAGADMINLGAEVSPERVASEAKVQTVEAILVSTHNGMALEYARRLKDQLDGHKVNVPVLMGGVLNQASDETALPVDVSKDVEAIGFYPCPRLGHNFKNLLAFKETH